MWVSALARRTPKDRGPGNHPAAGPFGVRDPASAPAYVQPSPRVIRIVVDDAVERLWLATCAFLRTARQAADDLAHPGD